MPIIGLRSILIKYALNSLRGKSGLPQFCWGRTLKMRFQKERNRRSELMGTERQPEIYGLPAGRPQRHSNGSPERPTAWRLLHYPIPGPTRLKREASVTSFAFLHPLLSGQGYRGGVRKTSEISILIRSGFFLQTQ